MSALFDEDTIRRIYVEEEREKARAAGRAESRRMVAREMLMAGEPRSKIMQYTKITDRELDELQQGSV